ncbi:LAGLIDADG family homing endonuclease [Bacillus glycinifermentans]|uniref:ribonucleotide reductase N-terminal alpha domain-containing protein n=1 Tax=Bacillus glycinifermentans TaxID=1664069 RepID=UPI00263B5135|nr:ribonucleotide reductase N-terminal alpha domain-containing protein [Bacillus glycinifermentans]WKB79671.1 LAGLIDADG family homing endonuclease [Bacillus glycinifermentans]
MIQKGGKFQFEKDKEAVHSYFVDYVNQNTVFFHDLKEKLDYLLENDYYEEQFLSLYTFEQIKEVFKLAYSFKFRFPSFMSAFKFYNDYALKTNDKTKILERYEDRVSIVALYLGNGDFEKAKEYTSLMMKQEYQPSTPTFLNAGRKRRGEMVSCFLLEVNDSLNDISRAIDISMQLSKLGGGVALNLNKIRAKGEPIKEVENATKGVVGVMKLLDNAFRYADQMGQRQGSGAAYLNVFHPDINDFLDTKKISADEDVRAKTLSIGVVIPDKFIELAREDKDFYMFYPYSVYKEYGQHLDEMDIAKMYDELVENPNVRKKKANARKLLEKLAILRSESGYPYLMFADNVNRFHANSHISKVKFSNLCVTGDTFLLTENGYEKASDLYKSQKDLRVVIDNRTKQFDKDCRGTSIVNAIPMQLTKKNADVFKVKTKQGFEIRATEWHKFYVKRNNEIQKLQLNQLVPGDKLLIQSGEGEYGSIHEPDLAYIMGIIAGDGTITDKTAKIYLYDNKKVLEKKVKDAVHRVIDKHKINRVYKHNTSFTPKFVAADPEKQDLLYMSSTVLFDILNKYGMTKETKTRVPEFLYQADKETQAAYLSGLFQTDGCVNANHKAKALTIELTSVDFESLQDVQKLLINMGVYTTIYTNNKRSQELLPDGRGGSKLYKVKPTHKLSIQDRASRELFMSIVDLKEYDKYKFNMLTETLQAKSRKPKHDFTAEIISIEKDGVEDVYDTTQEDYHSLIFNGIVTGNCSEVLQASQVSTYTDYGEEDEIGLDISCNLGSINIFNVMKNGSIKNTVKLAIDALTHVSNKTNITNAPAVAKANKLMRSVGLGAMNLHGFLAQNGIAYESEEARDFANTFFMMMNYYSLGRSMEIAKETGETYYQFEGSTYKSGEYFKKYEEQSFSPKFEKVKKLFGDQHIPTIEDWKQLKKDVMKYGLYHSYRQAIAPTGSISYVQSSTAGVMPIMERIEERTYGNSKTYYPMPGLSAKNWFFYKEAYDMDMFKVVDMIATIQQHVDQGISFTLFLKDTMTTRDLNRIDLYAHHRGIKTLYYARTKDTGQEGCLSCVV